MNVNEIQLINQTYNQVIEAITLSRKSVYLDNLRSRSKIVSFDSKVRGYLGEILISELLKNHNIKILSVNSNYKNQNIDTDIEVLNPKGKKLKIECKTSLIPDIWNNLENVVKFGDIKIIKRETNFNESLIDFHIQIYFNELRNKRDILLNKLDFEIESVDNEHIMKIMKYNSLEVFIVSWIDKKSLQIYLEKQTEKIWRFGQREFWKCPIKISNPPIMFIEAIKDY
jgi:hypothetical protein